MAFNIDDLPGWKRYLLGGTDAFAVTPSNTVDFTTPARALYIGTVGNVVVISGGGTPVTFSSVPAGSILPIYCTRINATGTTASSIVALV